MISSDDGYSLLELVVATALVALMSLPLSQGIGIGIRTWQQVHLEASKQERVYLLRQRLKDWIAASYPFDVTRQVDVARQAGARIHPLTGSGTTLTLVTPLNPDPRVNILYRIRFRLEDTQLQMGYMPDHASYDGTGFSEWTPLLPDVERFEVSYLEPLGPGSLAWVSDWRDKARLPVAVRVRMTFLDETLIWPDLLVPLEVDQWARCVLDNDGACEAWGAVG